MVHSCSYFYELTALRQYSRNIVFQALQGNFDYCEEAFEKSESDSDLSNFSRCVLESIKDAIVDHKDLKNHNYK